MASWLHLWLWGAGPLIRDVGRDCASATNHDKQKGTSMKRTWITLGIALLAVVFTAHAATVWDLRTEWSDTQNPNGVWSYNAGNTVLPWVQDLPHMSGSSQGGWAVPKTGQTPATLPFWFRFGGPPSSSFDFDVGDVVVHTTAEGSTTGEASIKWTSPITGVIDIEGSAWMDDYYPERGNRWTLYVRGHVISTALLSATDPYSRTNRFDFSQGSGGSSALENIPVVAGDVVTLEFARTTRAGYFSGVDLTIRQQVVPRPTLGIRVSEVELCWDTVTNGIYQLQYRSTLTTNEWVPFHPDFIRGDGSMICTNDTVIVGQPQRYYRVVATNAPPGL
jgi:hypothetical protein